jgi:calcineurin-like phosphoesterase family protein
MEGTAKKFYIADWHYGHANCIFFDNRPFRSVEHMNAELVRRWNEAVKPGDIVYILGDMFWCKTTEAIAIIKQLNGTKILIKGNHDRVRDAAFAKCFAKIVDYEEVQDDEDNIVLSHYPIPCFKNHFYGWLHFYGHVHTSFEYNMMQHNRYLMEELYTKPCAMYNIGAMIPYMNYTPRTKDEILQGELNEFDKYRKTQDNNQGE